MIKCHNCDGAGWTVIATGANGETPEQCQCEWCGGTGEGRELLELDETYTGDIERTSVKQPKPATDLVLTMKYEPPHEFPFIPDKPKEHWRGGRPR